MSVHVTKFWLFYTVVLLIVCRKTNINLIDSCLISPNMTHLSCKIVWNEKGSLFHSLLWWKHECDNYSCLLINMSITLALFQTLSLTGYFISVRVLFQLFKPEETASVDCKNKMSRKQCVPILEFWFQWHLDSHACIHLLLCRILLIWQWLGDCFERGRE